MRPGGVLCLIYETPAEEQAGRVTDAVVAALANHGFETTVTAGGSPSLLCISGRPTENR